MGAVFIALNPSREHKIASSQYITIAPDKLIEKFMTIMIDMTAKSMIEI